MSIKTRDGGGHVCRLPECIIIIIIMLSNGNTATMEVMGASRDIQKVLSRINNYVYKNSGWRGARLQTPRVHV